MFAPTYPEGNPSPEKTVDSGRLGGEFARARSYYDPSSSDPPPPETPLMSATLTPPAKAPDAWRVEIFKRPDQSDPAGAELVESVAQLGISGLSAARLGRGYLLSKHLTRSEVDSVVRELLTDPVLEEARIGAPREPLPPHAAAHRVLVAKKPGVMDPIAQTVRHSILRTALIKSKRELFVTTFQAWELEGTLSADQVELIGRRLLANVTIEDLYLDNEGLTFDLPKANSTGGRQEVALLALADDALETLSREGQLSLDLNEMRTIQAHFKELDREPTVCELESLAQTWSEHCKHKTFAGTVIMDGERIENLLKETVFRATRVLDRDWCVSVFHDNAGIVEFDQGYDLCFKVETHNHPSAIDPYGGAGTGIGGVIRDILGVGLGARPIANTNAFFVGPDDLPADKLPKGCMHPRRILRGMVHGVRDYGNRMGIPTVSGGLWYDEGYVANPLVYAGTVGLMPHEFAHKSVAPGDLIVVAGGRTGLDGIHGATFSSVELHEESETISAAAVQIGDPITEKRVCEALLHARDEHLYRGLTDCGAGGLSSAVGEMGEECGAEVDLEKVPLKYPGLAPHEIWISEAQERMVFAVQPENLERFLEVMAEDEVEATVIGSFTDTKQLVLKHDQVIVADIGMEFLHDGTPKPERQAHFEKPDLPDPGCPPCDDAQQTLLDLMASPNLTSREWIIRQYDHEVQGMSVLKPLVGVEADAPGDGAVLKPLSNSKKGVAITCGANPRQGRLDPFAMATASIDEALRNAVAVGGDPDKTSLLDNFSWGNCNKPDRLGALVLAARGCHDAAIAFKTPFISGKDSLNNEYRVDGESRSIPPTLFVSAMSIVPDVSRALSSDLAEAGNTLYLVGETHAELGASHYHGLLDLDGGTVPRPDLERAPELFRALHAALAAGLARSCHDLSEGGLACAAAEMAFGGGLGATIELAKVPASDFPVGFDADATRLFSESCTRLLVEVPAANCAAFEEALGSHPHAAVGRVEASQELRILSTTGKELLTTPIDRLRSAHHGRVEA